MVMHGSSSLDPTETAAYVSFLVLGSPEIIM